MLRRGAFASSMCFRPSFSASRLSAARATVSSLCTAATLTSSPPAAAASQIRGFSSAAPTKKLLVRGAGSHGSSNAGSGATSGGGGAFGGGSNPFSSIMQNNTPVTSGGSSGGGGNEMDAMTPQIKTHLFRVYNLLAAGVAAASCGSAMMIFTPMGKSIPYIVPGLGALVPLLWLSFAPPASQEGKLALFFAFTVLEGMAIAPIVLGSAMKGVLGTALVLTAAVFIGFSAAAYLSPRGSLLKFYGPLMGIMLGMMAISILNIFWPSAFAHSIILYGGLALFSILIAVDTQAMIERARCGAGDHVQDAISLFINVINIFVRIASILRGMGE